MRELRHIHGFIRLSKGKTIRKRIWKYIIYHSIVGTCACWSLNIKNRDVTSEPSNNHKKNKLYNNELSIIVNSYQHEKRKQKMSKIIIATVDGDNIISVTWKQWTEPITVIVSEVTLVSRERDRSRRLTTGLPTAYGLFFFFFVSR